MSVPEFKDLLQKYNNGTCTDAEKMLIESWYVGFELKNLPELTDEQLAEILSLQPEIAPAGKIRPMVRWIAAAAAILVFVTAGIYMVNRRPVQQAANNAITEISPGTNKAVLTLANGKKIILNGRDNGNVAHEGSIMINKTAEGNIEYTLSGENVPVAGTFLNTMSTPRGGQYHLVLADGTGVWLNAASSITYPAVFTGADRRVEITGEVYFEVAHNKEKPFRVITNGQVVEVLGTHFNVNAYADEPVVKTTLFQGSVRVTRAGDNTAVILKPGEQSVLSSTALKAINTDTEEAIAWKNGDFVFKNQTLPGIMRNISRWYNVSVTYKDAESKHLTFSGVVSRSRNLSAVLKMMEATGQVKFEVQGTNVRVIN